MYALCYSAMTSVFSCLFMVLIFVVPDLSAKFCTMRKFPAVRYLYILNITTQHTSEIASKLMFNSFSLLEDKFTIVWIGFWLSSSVMNGQYKSKQPCPHVRKDYHISRETSRYQCSHQRFVSYNFSVHSGNLRSVLLSRTGRRVDTKLTTHIHNHKTYTSIKSN